MTTTVQTPQTTLPLPLHPEEIVIIGFAGGYGNVRVRLNHFTRFWLVEEPIDEKEHDWKTVAEFNSPASCLIFVAERYLGWQVES